MIKEAIEKIVELAGAHVFYKDPADDSRPYSSKVLHPIVDPAPTALCVNTLTGLIQYLNDKIDGWTGPDPMADVFVHVQSPTKVLLRSHIIETWMQRYAIIEAVHAQPEFRFNAYLDVESVIIGLQTQFIQTAQIEAILKVIGNLKDEKVTTYGDDGVSQSVTAKAGIAAVHQIDVPRIVTLQPLRTFSEIQQPGGHFILRLRSAAQGQLPGCGIWQIDDASWQLVAMGRIRDHLVDGITAKIPVIL